MGALDSLTNNGPLARYVQDLALTLPIIAGADSWDPAIVSVPLGDPKAVDLKGLRVAVHTDNGIITPQPEIMEAVKQAATVLKDAGLSVEEDAPQVLGRTHELMERLFNADGAAWIRRLLQKAGTIESHPWTQAQLDQGGAVSTAEFTGMLEEVDAFRSAMHAFMQNYDVILCPVCSYTALPHGSELGEKVRMGYSYCGTYNITGWPGVVVRGGTSAEGLPIGVQVVGRPWREDLALAVAQCLETALGDWQRPPI